MIKVYYTEIKGVPDNAVFEQEVNNLPGAIRNKILSYSSYREQCIRLCGKLLLLSLIRHFQLDNLTLNDLKYSEWGKPFFNTDFDFSIAHSGDIVICAGTMNAKTGIDIEVIKEQDIYLFKDYFTKNEWDKINCSENKNEAFYKMWIRKEAYTKATGKGSFLSLADIDVCENRIVSNDAVFYLQDILIKDCYAACIATDDESKKIAITEVSLNTLINYTPQE